MNIILVLAFSALLLIIASLVAGVISMAHGGEYDRKHSTHFMFARIGFQVLAVVLLMQLAYLSYV